MDKKSGRQRDESVSPKTRNKQSWLLTILRNKKGFAGFLIVSSILAVALLAPYIAPYDPTRMHLGNRFSSPDGQHLLGTDFFGRDILSRIIYGYRVSLGIAFLSVVIAVILGGSSGIIAGYFGGSLETLIMRVMDVLFAFPVMLLAIAIVVVLGAGATSTLLAIGIVYVPVFSRIARGPTLAVKEESYIEAAKALGLSGWRVVLAHILPNVSVPIFVQATINLARAILFEAALSFLGLGARPPHPSLGVMVSEGRKYIEISPWTVVFPGIAIVLIVLGFNLLGDALQETLNPELRSR